MKKVLILSIILVIALFLCSSAEESKTQITPYGFVLLSGVYNDNITSDLPVVFGYDKATHSFSDSIANFLMTARQTRFGLKFSNDGPNNPEGVIEVDFFGLKGSSASGGVTQSAIRLRLAYFKLSTEKASFLFGQYWAPFAPLSPTSIAYVSVLPLTTAGNLWARIPQVKVEYKAAINEKNSILFEAAALRPFDAYFTPEVSQKEELGPGEWSGVPFVEGRISANIKDETAIVGFSFHAGNEDFKKGTVSVDGEPLDFGEKVQTFGIAFDGKVKYDKFSLCGEYFDGKNLPMFGSHNSIELQDANDDPTETFDDIVKIAPKTVRGGWIQLSATASENISFNVGYGREFTPSRLEYRNEAAFGNVMIKSSNHTTVALEVGNIKTTIKEPTRAKVDASNLNFNFGFKLDF
jgi:hypothetical protein